MKKADKLTKDKVEHVAKLARINISEEEKELYSSQLNSILEYINKLNEVETDNVSEATNMSGLKNVIREDVAISCTTYKNLIEAAPESEMNMIKVKAVLKGGKQ